MGRWSGGMDLEWSSHGLLEHTIRAFTWKDSRKSQKISATVAGSPAKTETSTSWIQVYSLWITSTCSVTRNVKYQGWCMCSFSFQKEIYVNLRLFIPL